MAKAKSKARANTAPAQPAAKKAKKGGAKGSPQKKKAGVYASDSLATELSVVGLRIVEVQPDGNCLFRALADQLQGLRGDHVELRARIVGFITQQRDFFENFVEDDEEFDHYIARIAEDGTWGGHLELQAAVMLLQVNICIHQAASPVWTLQVPDLADGAEARTLHLSYHDGDHYNSIRSGDDTGDGPAQPIKANWQAGAAVIEAFAAEKAAGWSIEREEHVMQCTGCADRTTAADALKAAGGNVDTAIELLIEQQASEALAEHRRGEESKAAPRASPSDLPVTDQPSGTSPTAATLPADGTAGTVDANTTADHIAATALVSSLTEQQDGSGSGVLPSEDAVSPTEAVPAAGDSQAGKGGKKAAPDRRKTRHQPPRHRTCVCGSGKKFKQCCGSVQGRAAAVAAAAKPPDRQLAQLLI